VNRSRRFKIHRAAVDHAETMYLKGHADVGIFRNTKIYKTERVL